MEDDFQSESLSEVVWSLWTLVVVLHASCVGCVVGYGHGVELCVAVNLECLLDSTLDFTK